MSPRSRRRAPLATVGAEALLWSLLLFAPLALGSAPSWTLTPIVLAALAAGLLSFVGATARQEPVSLPLFSLVLALIAALCLLQLLPLPPFLLGVASPAARELQDFALVPLGLTRWRPVSLEPAATWRELSKHLAYLSVFLASVQLSRSKRVRRRLLMAIAATGTLVAVIGLGHLLFDAKSLFGLYTFKSGVQVITPFGNRNHLAGYLILAGTTTLGLALSATDRQRSLLWGVAYVCMGSVVLLSLSRGGITFFLFGQALFAALLLRRSAAKVAPPSSSGRRPAWVRLSGAAFAALLSVVAVGAYIAYEQLVARAETVSTVERLSQTKIELYPSMADAAAHFWVAGMGRGAFEVGFTRFQDDATATFTHAENAVLHLWAELGLVPALVLFALAGWALSKMLRRDAMGIKDFAVIAGVLAVALHNLFDFNLEYPACALTACVMLGVASRPDENAEGKPTWKGLLWAAPALSVLALAALLPGRDSAGEAEEELTARLKARAPLDEVRTLAVRLIDAHPADYLLYSLMGLGCATDPKGDPREALAFVNRALYLRPLDGPAHQVAARSLLRLGKRSQALHEFRLAADSGVTTAYDEALKYAKDVDQVRSLVSAEPAPLEQMIGRLRAKGRAADADALLAWALVELKDRKDADGLWILEANRQRAKKDYPAALAALAEAEKRNPAGTPLGLSRAAVLSEMGKKDEAVALLQAMIVQHPDDVGLAFTLAEQLAAYRKFAQARETLARATPFLKSLDQRAALFAMEGRMFAAEGRYAKALQAFQSAARVQPLAAGHQYSIAQMYEAMGKFPEASQAVRAGMRMSGASAALDDWIKRLGEKEAKRVQANDQRLLEQKPEAEE
jgi:tetratricopeptide (TPR) repeat protein